MNALKMQAKVSNAFTNEYIKKTENKFKQAKVKQKRFYEDSLDSIPLPSSSVKIQLWAGKFA